MPAVALFPVTPEELKTADGSEATNPDNLICRAVRAVKEALPELGRDLRRGARPLHDPRP